MKLGLSVIWLIFLLLFGYLSHMHYQQSKVITPPFGVPERIYSQLGTIKIFGRDISNLDEPFRAFVTEFNRHIAEQNKISQKMNGASAIGYGAAAVIALISLALVWIEPGRRTIPEIPETSEEGEAL